MIIINRSNTLVFGLFLMLVGILLFVIKPLDVFIRPITNIFLMGSSVGKDILFFEILGFFIVISSLLKEEGYLDNQIKKFSKNNKNKFIKSCLEKHSDYFIKKIIILSLIAFILGIVIEVYLRLSLNLPTLTTFVSMNPSPNTTSILHSHVFKGIITQVFTGFISVPSSIHTGNSLITYISPVAYIVFLIIPLIVLFTILTFNNTTIIKRIFVIFSSTCLIIGIIDGGLFATPSILGLLILYWSYSSEENIKEVNSKIIINDIKNGLSNLFIIISIIFLIYVSSLLIYGLVNFNLIFIPLTLFVIAILLKYYTKKDLFNHIDKVTIVIGFLIIIRIIIGLMGTNISYYEVNIENSDVELNESQVFKDFNILNKVEYKNSTKYIIKSENNNEKKTLLSLRDNLKNKTNFFSMTWNNISFLNKMLILLKF